MASVPQCADTVGVEEEFLLVDTASGRTSVRADAVLARVQDSELTKFHAELAGTQVEAATGPCTSVSDLGEALRQARGTLEKAAEEVGLGLLSRGTPQKPSRQEIVSLFDKLARDMEITALMRRAEEQEEEELIRLLM